MIHISQEELFKNIELNYKDQSVNNNIDIDISQGHSCHNSTHLRDMSSILGTTSRKISDKNNNNNSNQNCTTAADEEDEVQAVLITGNNLQVGSSREAN